MAIKDYKRLCPLSKGNSFFLFGPRATGKTTLLKQFFSDNKNHIWIDLLEPETERELSVHPSRLSEIIHKHKMTGKPPIWVIIDEIQKAPRLLDVVHKLIFEKAALFALTGSSARKLRRGHANMLAGRAFSFNLHPLSFTEVGPDFDLHDVMRWGSLPAIQGYPAELEKKRYLLSYVQNYIKEEILVEQIVRNIEPFRAFLEVTAQSNTLIINYARLAREAQIEPKSVERYFEILSDTLLGFILPPFSRSIRKRQVQSPKFYFFDMGVTNALSGSMHAPVPGSYGYGRAFEQIVVTEAYRLNDYHEKNCKLSFLRTKDGVEIDLVVEHGRELALVEIKSSTNVCENDLKGLRSLAKDIKGRKYVFCNEKWSRRTTDGINILPWREGLKEIFG
ncbi:MAG: hypothetical protein A2583_07645 [Bdellovibrionales bacterium RIFOXYD1_FULL_53_11]|nr:MAG: hypothetical protein A2583_07645 [Bdellovibrionales bacterium RIFOXYD1_FULL_53_11]